jgi:hypothetical protein
MWPIPAQASLIALATRSILSLLSSVIAMSYAPKVTALAPISTITQRKTLRSDGAWNESGTERSKSMFILPDRSPHPRQQLAPWNQADLF